MEYEAVIGLEVHAELSTKSKLFCSCTTEFGGRPNTHCCPVCLGMPGTLPALNRKAIEYTIKAGLATNCTISRFTKQDRKNYFYPDLPKGYQISQYDLPLCKNGYVEIETENGKKKIRINRIHLEEDAGKLVHSEYGHNSYVDYNRTGVPLIEVVSEPDISSAAEAKAYLEKLKAILQFIGVSDCKMEEGSLRADVNISIRPKGSKELGERTEMKNLNSFRAIYRAIEAEVARQIEVVRSGGTIQRETRRWDDAKGKSYPMRSKEDAQDYRYFPEPDLPPLIIKEELIQRLKNELPELPDARKQRYMTEYGLPEYDAGVLTSSKELSDFFEEAAKASNNVKAISNWVMGDMLRILNERNLEVSQVPFPPAYLAKLVALLDKGVINGPTAKKVFEEMFDSGKDPEAIVKEQGLEVLNDESLLLQVVEKVIQENPNSVADYKKGKKKAIGFLVGQAMKATKGKANPQLLNELLVKKLEE
ncbi:MAG: Asp-tRNA(Asn)/Glu-tRNA(Gln) amidotransferase subunit GatB [Caldicoprobacter sp.]|uniref:Asp-tRNA(Asn)/Glu-tRNA(Gln) amidotransferase subunit GatB n=1 Tax=Caldicoprobacter sp. TaxID=2004500 RepID=UPI001D7A8EB4|nr:Asp-tRNA(Asn)/Glu-tRNA(Gln) amidotransferase GatCAB subunit B [Clostridia bacterium]